MPSSRIDPPPPTDPVIGPDGHVAPAASVKTVAAPFRSNEQIVGLLDRIAVQPDFPDELALRRALDILDDLAEEMIGRHGPADVAIKDQIQAQSARLRTGMP